MDAILRQMRPLFILGNKRSGTSHLTGLLNRHPHVFVSSESDIIWILYQIDRGLTPRCYDWDGPVGMQATLSACSEIVHEPGSVRDKYFRIQDYLMRHGSAVQSIVHKHDLAWVGDKKPVQASDPTLHAFIREHLSDARFIHIVRHPRAVVGSMLAAGRSWAQVEYWREGSKQVLGRWVEHENWAQKAAALGDVIDVRFEDLVSGPKTMETIFSFLEVDPIALDVEWRTDWNDKYTELELELGDARPIMDRYGYS